MIDTMDLIQKIQADDAAQRREAWRRYGELLEAGNGTAKEVAEMKRLMGVLGRTTADLEDDCRTVRTAREYLGMIRRAAGQSDLAERANLAREAVAAEFAAIARRYNRRLNRLSGCQQQAQILVSAGNNAQDRLGNLKALCAELLADVVIPDRDSIIGGELPDAAAIVAAAAAERPEDSGEVNADAGTNVAP